MNGFHANGAPCGVVASVPALVNGTGALGGATVPPAKPHGYLHNPGPVSHSVAQHSDMELSEDRPTSKAESISDPESDDKFKWVRPSPEQQPGGKWLKGRTIRVYWDGEQRWYTGIVLRYDPDHNLIDSHGAAGPLHLVRYEDGDYEENLANAVWHLAWGELDAAVARESTPEESEELLPNKPWTSRIAGQKRGRPPDQVMKEQRKAALLSKARNGFDGHAIDDLNPSFLRTREDGEGKGSRIRKPSQKMKMAMTDFAYDTDDCGGGFKSEMVNLGHIIEGKKKRRYKKRFVDSESDDDDNGDFVASRPTMGGNGMQGSAGKRKGRSRSLPDSVAQRLFTSVSPLFVGCALQVRRSLGWVNARCGSKAFCGARCKRPSSPPAEDSQLGSGS